MTRSTGSTGPCGPRPAAHHPPTGPHQVEVTWRIYQQAIAAYAHPDDPRTGRTLLARAIDTIRAGLPAGLDELATLGRTLHRRRADVLAYVTHRASNGPTEAINDRLEALRRNALSFRNLLNYRIRSPLHCGALAPQIRKSPFPHVTSVRDTSRGNVPARSVHGRARHLVPRWSPRRRSLSRPLGRRAGPSLDEWTEENIPVIFSL